MFLIYLTIFLFFRLFKNFRNFFKSKNIFMCVLTWHAGVASSAYGAKSVALNKGSVSFFNRVYTYLTLLMGPILKVQIVYLVIHFRTNCL